MECGVIAGLYVVLWGVVCLPYLRSDKRRCQMMRGGVTCLQTSLTTILQTCLSLPQPACFEECFGAGSTNSYVDQLRAPEPTSPTPCPDNVLAGGSLLSRGNLASIETNSHCFAVGDEQEQVKCPTPLFLKTVLESVPT